MRMSYDDCMFEIRKRKILIKGIDDTISSLENHIRDLDVLYYDSRLLKFGPAQYNNCRREIRAMRVEEMAKIEDLRSDRRKLEREIREFWRMSRPRTDYYGPMDDIDIYMTICSKGTIKGTKL